MKPGPTIDQLKLSKLQELAALDAQHPHVQEAARTLRDLVSNQLGLGGVRGDRVFAQLVHALARDAIKQIPDTAQFQREDIAGLTRAAEHPFAVLRREGDDCDAKARLFVALARAGGLRAEIVPLWAGSELKHVSARVQVGGAWLPVELTLARARLGELPNQIPFERNARDWART